MTQKNQKNLIKLMYSDRALETNFFQTIWKAFPPKKSCEVDTEEMSYDVISKLNDKELSSLAFQILGNDYSFVIEIQPQEKIEIDHLIVLVEVGDELEKQYLEALKKYTQSNVSILIIIHQPSSKIKKSTVDIFEKQILKLLKNQQSQNLQNIFTIRLCLSQSEPYQEFGKKLRFWINQNKIKRISLEVNQNGHDSNILKELNLLLESFQILNWSNCLQKMLRGNLQEASLQIIEGFRQEFKNSVKKNQALSEFINNYQKRVSQQQLKKMVTKILQCYEVPDHQENFKLLLSNHRDLVINKVNPSKRQQFIKELESCKKLKPFQKHKPKQKNLIQEVKQQLSIICSEFSVKNIQQCVEQLLSNNLEEASLNVGKKLRKLFIEEVNQCDVYKLYLRKSSASNDNSALDLISATESLLTIMQKYKIRQKEKCLELLLNEDLETAASHIKQQLRQEFISEVSNCENFRVYLESKKQQNSADNFRKALSTILQKYVPKSDIKQFIQLILQNKLQEALDDIKKTKRDAFVKQLNQLHEYQSFIAKFKPNLETKYSDLCSQLAQYNLEPQKLKEVLQGLENGKIIALKQQLKKDFFIFLEKLLEKGKFDGLFKNSQFKQISYFYYYVSQVQFDNILNILLQKIDSSTSIKQWGPWLQSFSVLSISQKMLTIFQELSLLDDIVRNTQQNQKAKFIFKILQGIKTIILLINYKHVSKQIQKILKGTQRKLNHVQKLIEEEEKSNVLAKDIFGSQSIQATKKIERLIKFMKEKNKIQSHLQVKNKIQIVKKFFKIFVSQKIYENQIKLMIQQQKKILLNFLSQRQYFLYFPQKQKEIKYRLYNLFFNYFQDEISEMKVQVKLGNDQFKIILNKEMDPSTIRQCIYNVLGKNQQLLIQLLLIDKTRVFLQENAQVKGEIQKVECFRKSRYHLQFRTNVEQIIISKYLHPQSIKAIIYQNIKSQNIMQISLNNIKLFGVFGNSSIQMTESIEKMQVKTSQPLKFLKLLINMSVTIYYDDKIYKFILHSDSTISQVKKKIFQITDIPIQSQSLSHAKNDKDVQVLNQKLDQLQPNRCIIILTLISKMNLEHYGFHENYHLSFQGYQQFYIQNKNDIQNMVNFSSLKLEEQRNFFDQLIKLLYSAIKRKFPFSHVVEQVKNQFIFKKSIQIWYGKNFTEYFLLYYILYNADKKLRIQLISILRTFNPIPLYFKVFQNINNIQDSWIINEEILWLLHQGLCITSVGFHNKQLSQQKGKTYLNNKIFFTNFQECNTRHPISSKCPEIILKALGGITPVNIIDIPALTPKDIVENILKVTDFLVVHSWLNKQQTRTIIDQIKKVHQIRYVVCILRDCGQRNETLARVKNVDFQEEQFLQLYNLGQSINKQQSFIKILNDKIWEFGNKCFLGSKTNEKSIYKLFNNKIFEQFNDLSSKLKDNFLDMKLVFSQYQKIKYLQKQNSTISLKNAEEIKESTIKKNIALHYKQILIFIQDNKDHSQVLLLRFRQILKQLKNNFQRKYFIINQYKKKIALLPKEKKEQLQKVFMDACRQIQDLPKMRKAAMKNNQAQMIEQLSTILEFFQNEVKSNFFTIQIAWRELQYLTTLDSQVKLGNYNLIDLLIDLKRKEISNNQPFQLLDGDLLQMPKNIIKKVFEGISDRVAVITILGPQSSGKSTLLNFLFGCDFGTSEGRCTRGVYGTFFKFSNRILSNCEGIFLIDTQGLFATLSKKDQTKRRDFDSKLVLFCLAVSDFVIINTKGNLDSQSSRILKSSMQRFAALTQQNMQWPQIYLILNQNNNSNIQTSEADINKFRDLFSVQNAYALNQAYKLNELSKKDIIMLPEDENLVKRQPRPQFSSLTYQLQESLISKIQSKSMLKPIGVVIDLMERVWSTIEAFPDLGKTSSKKIQQIQNRIKQWRIKQIENLSRERQKIFDQFKLKAKKLEKCQDQFSQKVKQIMAQFTALFIQKDEQSMTQDQKNKIQSEEKTIYLAFQAIQYELISQISDQQKAQLAQKTKSQGGEFEKEAIRVVKKIQRDQKKTLPRQVKQKYFNQAFNKSLEQIKLVSAPEQHLQNTFKRIYEFYSSALNISTANKSKKDINKNAGLPKAEWKCLSNIYFNQFSQIMKNKIFNEMGKDSNKYIEFKKSPPTRVLNENERTDAKLKYFNMREYFQKVKVKKFIQIQPNYLNSSLKIEILKNQFSDLMSNKKDLFYRISKTIFEKINSYFKIFNFKLSHYQKFKEYLQYKMSLNPFRAQPNIQVKNFYQHTRQQKAQTSQKDAKVYLNVQSLKIKVGQINYLTQYSYYYPQYKNIREKFLSKCLKSIINWEAIIKYFKNSQDFYMMKKQANQIINQRLNQDLNKIGININCKDFYQYISGLDKKVKMNFSVDKQLTIFQNQNLFYQTLKQLNYFKDTQIRTYLKKTITSISYYPWIRIGQYYQQTFEVMDQFKSNKELKTYISSNTNKVYVDLQSDTMKQFVYNQLIKKNKFTLLTTNINQIIRKSPDYLTLNTITGIFIDVDRQIAQFNDDLSQVSHKLTLLFTGYIHLYAIYLTWKKFQQISLIIANKPFQDLLKTKQKQLYFFLNETSDNQNLRTEGETDRFLNEVINYCKNIIIDHKHKLNKSKAKSFKNNYPRKTIQDEIDHECFSIASKQQYRIDYLTNPAKTIQEKYKSLTNHNLQELRIQYQQCQKVQELIKELKELVSLLLQRLMSGGLNEDTIHTNIIGIQKKNTQKDISISDSEVLEKINLLMMQFLLDLLVTEQKDSYNETDFIIKINKKCQLIKLIRQPTPSFQGLIAKIKQQKLSLTRFYTFVSMIDNKLNQRIVENNIKVIKFDSQINDLTKMTLDDQKAFLSLVAVKICKELCPCCQRICGVEEPHTNNHECRYGHQMRALGGVRLSNGDASVIRCQDVELMSEIHFNGEKMTWKQFKQYWQKKPSGSWSFADLKNQNNKEIFIKAWDIAGQAFCKKQNMKFVKYNQYQKQKIQTQPTHYIFALDDSGSMSTQRWLDLMVSYEAAIKAIKKIPDSETAIKVSVLIQGSACIVFQENVTPSAVNLNIKPRYGGNNFADTFGKAHKLMVKYVGGAKIKYIFMTDGGCRFPRVQTGLIKTLQNNHPEKIEYYGIQFQTSGDTMKLICGQLKGSNKISYNLSQLTSAYLEIINRQQ